MIKVTQLNAKAEAQAALAAREENLSAKERRKMARLSKSNLRLVCGACGGKVPDYLISVLIMIILELLLMIQGHMKTNKACPNYVGDPVLEGLQLQQQAASDPIKVTTRHCPAVGNQYLVCIKRDREVISSATNFFWAYQFIMYQG